MTTRKLCRCTIYTARQLAIGDDGTRKRDCTYEDAKEQVIFHGTEGAPAVLMRQVRVGAPPEETRGRKITYSRGTGQFKIDDGQWLGGGS